jgi:integrase
LGYDGNGKRKRRTVYGSSKAEVQEKLRQLQQQNDQGRLVDAPSTTVAAFLASWLAGVKNSVRESTHSYYEGHVRLHITPRIGGTKLKDLSAVRVKAFYNRMAEDQVSTALRAKIGVTLSVALGEAVELGLIPANPARGVRKPRTTKQEMTAMTAGQAGNFLAAAVADRLFALYALALDTGARQGELYGLQWQDVDFDAPCIHVRRALRELKGNLSLGAPKTDASRRRIDVTQFALEALAAHRTRMLAEGNYRSDGQVFCDVDGGYLRKSNVQRRSFDPILKAAGLPKFRFHDLRHSTASLLLAAGESVKVVAERLGHANSAMTLNVYSHVTPGAQARAAARLDAILSLDTSTKKIG